jgi:hypothetical protein
MTFSEGPLMAAVVTLASNQGRSAFAHAVHI